MVDQEMANGQQSLGKGQDPRQIIALVNDDEDEGEEAEEEKLEKSTEDKFQFKNDQSFSQNSNLGNSQGNEQGESPLGEQREAMMWNAAPSIPGGTNQNDDISDDTAERMVPINNMTMGQRLNLGELAAPRALDVQ